MCFLLTVWMCKQSTVHAQQILVKNERRLDFDLTCKDCSERSIKLSHFAMCKRSPCTHLFNYQLRLSYQSRSSCVTGITIIGIFYCIFWLAIGRKPYDSCTVMSCLESRIMQCMQAHRHAHVHARTHTHTHTHSHIQTSTQLHRLTSVSRIKLYSTWHNAG